MLAQDNLSEEENSSESNYYYESDEQTNNGNINNSYTVGRRKLKPKSSPVNIILLPLKQHKVGFDNVWKILL